MNSATNLKIVLSGFIACAVSFVMLPARAQSESAGLILTPEEMLTEADMEIVEPVKAPPPAPQAKSVAQSKPAPANSASAKTVPVRLTKSDRTDFIGMADYYHHSLYGRKTSSGRVLHPHLMTAAHRTLPFGTRVRVTNKTSGKSCIVEINDRGPFTKNKVIDLSHAAAKHLGMIQAGTCKVACTVLNATEE